MMTFRYLYVLEKLIYDFKVNAVAWDLPTAAAPGGTPFLLHKLIHSDAPEWNSA